ncbi:alginate export family protein [Thalassotalea aquiviva]|uniref:alginate export family protein n=1 Tax=Thalassotalea aquiviva TaxID=3242415 RepID=UPI00352B9D81
MLHTNKSISMSLYALPLLSISSLSAQAHIGDDVAKAMTEAKVNLSFRYRLESVDQDNLDEDALASTLKSRVSVTTGKVSGFNALVEADNVTYIGNDSFNNTINGRVDYPVVADPNGTEINQANINYLGENFTFTLGRQRINLDDQRFVGGVGWRQNEQTYDGYRLQFSPFKSFKLDASYVFNVNRIFGEKHPTNSDFHGDIGLFNAKYSINKSHSLVFYDYYLDLDKAIANSSNTYGLTYQGNIAFNRLNMMLKAGLASQQDTGDNPNNYDADYYIAEVMFKLAGFTFGAGYEELGSDNGIGFKTPLATLHKFQGFTDQFLNTPASGIEDFYLKAATKFNNLDIALAWHNFEANKGNAQYGDEINFSVGYKFTKHVSTLFKAAHYNADDLNSDTNKLWFMISANY